MQELRDFARTQLGLADLRSWDIAYASEKLRQSRYSFSDQEVKQYFREDDVLGGMFRVVEAIYKIRVREAPERGRANDAVVEVLAGTLALPKRDVRLVHGHTGRDKLFELTGLTAAETERRLAAAELKGAA